MGIALPRIFTLLWLMLLLSACGGGSDSSDDNNGETIAKPTAVITLIAPQQSRFSLADGPVTVDLSGSNSINARNSTLTARWSWVSKPANSQAIFSADDIMSPQFTADLPGDYVISLTVNDGTASSDAVRLLVTATSPVPIAVTPKRHSIKLGTYSLELDGTASVAPTDATGPLEFAWSLVTQPETSAAYLTDVDQPKARLELDIEGEYIAQLIVSHQGIASKPVLVEIFVSSGNAQPVAVAADVTIKLGETVILDGSQSYDPENDPLQYRWSFYEIPKNTPELTLSGRTTATASFKPVAAGNYVLTFFVFDGEWKSEEITVTATVEPAANYPTVNQPPVGELVASGYSPSASVGEQELGLRADFKFIGYDPDGDTLKIVSTELLEKPVDSLATLVNIGAWEPLGHKIQKLDKLGIYKVRMTLTDGVNTITRDATMEAKIGGVNNRPSIGGVNVASQSVLVNDALIFDATSSDKDGDPLTFTWTLVDRPDGSSAVVEPLLEPESKEYRRARVVTDVPGSYTVRMVVSDDRGLQGVVARETSGFAKIENTAPVIRRVYFKRNWGSLEPNESYYQMLPCMSLLFSPLIIDPDGDKVYEHRELVSTPEGGRYTSSPGADCPANTAGAVFTKPGDYTFRYLASDGMFDSEPYNFTITIEDMANAKGVLLRNVGESSVVLHPLPYKNIPYFGFGATRFKPWTESRSVGWSVEALDSDYTVTDVTVRHINGDILELTPKFVDLVEGQVIEQGTTLSFSTWMPPVLCTRTDDATEGFHFSFRIKEIPEATFIYEYWLSATPGPLNEWPLCSAE